jgi:hypothetical protein
MKLLRDPLGRPIPRIYVKTEDLDERCERKIADFIDRHCGDFTLPIPTDDLIRMRPTTLTCTPTCRKKRTVTLISSPTGSRS